MAEHKGAKAPEKTAEGLRGVGVILYDVDPDQLACIACGQQWQAPAYAATGGTAPTAATTRGLRATPDRGGA
jgi:hypothetical protein